jgi:drug/metabolite transporter (DMT)-like permease
VAALLVAAVPLIVVVLRAVTGDRPRLATVAGVVIGFGGLATLVLSRGNVGAVAPVGAGIVLLAATSWACGSFFSQKLPLPVDPFTATVYEMLTGGLVLFAIGFVRGEKLVPAQVSLASWLALAYLIAAWWYRPNAPGALSLDDAGQMSRS